MRKLLAGVVTFLALSMSGQFFPANPYFFHPIHHYQGNGNHLGVLDNTMQDTLILINSSFSYGGGMYSGGNSVRFATTDTIRSYPIDVDKFRPMNYYDYGELTSYLGNGEFIKLGPTGFEYYNVVKDTSFSILHRKLMIASLTHVELGNKIYYANFPTDTNGNYFPWEYHRDTIYILTFDKISHKLDTLNHFALKNSKVSINAFQLNAAADTIHFYMGEYNDSLSYYVRYQINTAAFIDTVTYLKKPYKRTWASVIYNKSAANDSIYRIYQVDTTGAKIDSTAIYYDTVGVDFQYIVDLKDFTVAEDEFFVYNYIRLDSAGDQYRTFRIVKIDSQGNLVYNKEQPDTLFDHYVIGQATQVSDGILLFGIGRFGKLEGLRHASHNAFVLQIDTNGRIINPVSLNELNQLKLKISVYPIPANEKLIIDNQEEEALNYTLVKMNGQEISKGEIGKNKSIVLPTNQLERGNYLMLLQNADGKVFSKKVLLR